MEYIFDNFATSLKYLEFFEYLIIHYPFIKTVLDLGTGNTTRLCWKYRDRIDYTGIDDNLDYITSLQTEFDEPMNIHYLCSKINSAFSCYTNLNSVIKDKKFDLISVDGPFGWQSKLPRTNILSVIKSKQLNNNFFILMHDMNRNGERNLLGNIIKEFQKQQISVQVKCIPEPRGTVCITNVLKEL